MDKLCCKQCAHFLQHYAISEDRIFRVYCGHCTVPKVRRKAPDAPVCDNFSPGSPDEDAFATKKYLSKTLLEYMLNLELLPELQDMQKQYIQESCKPPTNTGHQRINKKE